MRVRMPPGMGITSLCYRMVHPGRAGVASEVAGAEVLVEVVVGAVVVVGSLALVGPGVPLVGTLGSKSMGISR
ncbi:MAG: hypothetical protein ACLFVK_03410 [Dehalococcoidia bacterium]